MALCPTSVLAACCGVVCLIAASAVVVVGCHGDHLTGVDDHSLRQQRVAQADRLWDTAAPAAATAQAGTPGQPGRGEQGLFARFPTIRPDQTNRERQVFFANRRRSTMQATPPTWSNLHATNRPVWAPRLGAPSRITASPSLPKVPLSITRIPIAFSFAKRPERRSCAIKIDEACDPRRCWVRASAS